MHVMLRVYSLPLWTCRPGKARLVPMENSEAETPAKKEKVPSPVRQEQGHPHPYPDWGAVQAYYGPGLPPPYFGSPIASGHAPHPYMWGPQPMMPPYGTPYAAIYPHGGIYAHPSVTMGTHSHGHVITSSTTSTDNVMASPLSIVTPCKSSGNKDKGLMKRLKSIDGLAVSIGNGTSKKTQGGAERGPSTSGESNTEGSSDGTEDNAQVGREKKRKRSVEDLSEKGGKDGNPAKGNAPGDANASFGGPGVITSLRTIAAGQPVDDVPSASPMTSGLDFRNLTNGKARNIASNISLAAGTGDPARDGLPSELWMQDERELKRERRKQSNRESARRSRLRKQAETEELAAKVETLNAENVALKSELNRLTDNLETLTQENSALKKKQKLKTNKGQAGELESPNGQEQRGRSSVNIENLLSRVNNSGSVTRSDESQENSSSGKLHQLLQSNSRPDAVAAS